MAAKTYREFLDIYDVPYTVVTVLYAASLLVFGISVAISKCCISVAISKCCKCEKVCSWIQPGSIWMIGIIFGSEGVSEEDSEKENPEVE